MLTSNARACGSCSTHRTVMTPCVCRNENDDLEEQPCHQKQLKWRQEAWCRAENDAFL